MAGADAASSGSATRDAASAPLIEPALIAPYCAWLVLELKSAQVIEPVDVQKLVAELGQKSKSYVNWNVVNTGLNWDGPAIGEGAQWDGAVFQVGRPPSWAITDGPWQDVSHHLVLTCGRGRFVMVHGPTSLLDSIRTAINNGRLARYRLVVPRILERAFLHGDAKLVYLGATHKRRRTKADAKALTGVAVQEALSPGSDSSYFLRASRVTASDWLAPNEVIGVSLGKSSVWLRRSQNWNDHLLLADRTLDRIEARAGDLTLPSAFPLLCEEQNSLDGVTGPYEMHSEPAISLSPDDDGDLLRDASVLDEADFRVVEAVNGTDAKVDVTWRGEDVLAFTARFRVDEAAGVVRLNFVDERVSRSPNAPKVKNALQRRELLSIHFTSGHTWSGERIYMSHVPNVRFPNWVWSDFDGINIRREKPGDPFDHLLIDAEHDDSIFSWIVRNIGQSGLITCDDGAGEIGDFIHLDYERGKIALIHAKAASSASSDRRIATTAFEVVAAQATKNLAHASIPALSQSLKARPKGATWVDGDRDDASRSLLPELLDLMDQGTPIDVAIVQPHLTRSALQAALDNNGAEGLRLRLLETLLSSARSEVTARAGDLTVYVSQ